LPAEKVFNGESVVTPCALMASDGDGIEANVTKEGEGVGWVTSQASDREAWSRMTVIGRDDGILLKSPA
jgi:hypothetical protein